MDEKTYQRIGMQVAETNARSERLDAALDKCQRLGSQQSHTIATLNAEVQKLERVTDATFDAGVAKGVEASAKIAEGFDTHLWVGGSVVSERIATAIRAKAEK